MSRRKKPQMLFAATAFEGKGAFGDRGAHRTVHSIGEPSKGGRHANFDESTKEQIIDALKPRAVKRKGELGRWPTQNEMLRSARQLVQGKGLASSDKIIKRQIISPMLGQLRSARNN